MRQIFTMVINLYAVRVVINILGVEDYGIYNAVAGVVLLFNFLSTALASASQRFISYDLGRKEYDNLVKTFSMTVYIYLFLSVAILILSFSVGLWLLENQLVIPAQRMDAARWTFYFALFSFFFSILRTPYHASIIAHEDMNYFAWLSIVEVSLRLILVFIIQVVDYDKLILYSFLMFLISLVMFGAYWSINRIKYTECKVILFWDSTLFKKILSFSSWNLFGHIAGVLRSQGVNILLNIFFGPTVNAARSIAQQVDGAVNSFGANFNVAVRPRIVKVYSQDCHSDVISLVFLSSKMTAFLLLIFEIPLMIEMHTVMNLWLGVVPEYVVVFTRITIIESFFTSISGSIMASVNATGNIRRYQASVGSIILLNVPMAYLALKLGADPVTTLIVGVGISILAFLFRIIIARTVVEFSGLSFLVKVLFRIMLVVVIAMIVPLIFTMLMPPSFLRLVVVTVVSIICTSAIIYGVGMTGTERKMLVSMIKKGLGKIMRQCRIVELS
jgi:O-antigen/teichoic acid export membrane protein